MPRLSEKDYQVVMARLERSGAGPKEKAVIEKHLSPPDETGFRRTPQQTLPAVSSELEEGFKWLLKQFAPDLLTGMVEQYEFAPPRKFRADFCWISERMIVEVEGGIHNIPGLAQGRHSQPKGIEGDCEKCQHAAAEGFRMFRITSSMIKKDPDTVIRLLRKALGR